MTDSSCRCPLCGGTGSFNPSEWGAKKRLTYVLIQLFNKGRSTLYKYTRGEITVEIQMMPVKSNTITAIGYNAARETLRVEFKDGIAYEYAEVLPHHYDALLNAESIGKFFAANIKTKFAYRKIVKEEPKHE